MRKRVIASQEAPAAIGPYSQAVASGDLLFTSGQIALDPASGQLLTGDIQAETRRAMENLGAVLKAAGGDFDAVLKVTIYLADMQDFAAVNEVYARYFQQAPPARATVQVSGLPKGARIEIDAVARIPASEEA